MTAVYLEHDFTGNIADLVAIFESHGLLAADRNGYL